VSCDGILWDCFKRLPPFHTGEISFDFTARSQNELLVNIAANVPMYMPTLYSDVVGRRHCFQNQPMNFQFKLDLRSSEVDTYPEIANDLEKLKKKISGSKWTNFNALCDVSIEHIYPVNTAIEVLREARDEISSLLEDTSEDLDSSTQGTQTNNEVMLSLVKEIMGHNLKVCASLLGGFIEHQI